MTRYSTDLPCRPLKTGDTCGHRVVEDARSAAAVFAERYAHRLYGRRGYCHHVRLDLHNEAGTWQHFEAFIGVASYRDRVGGTTGKNIRFDVKVLP